MWGVDVDTQASKCFFQGWMHKVFVYFGDNVGWGAFLPSPLSMLGLASASKMKYFHVIYPRYACMIETVTSRTTNSFVPNTSDTGWSGIYSCEKFEQVTEKINCFKQGQKMFRTVSLNLDSTIVAHVYVPAAAGGRNVIGVVRGHGSSGSFIVQQDS